MMTMEIIAKADGVELICPYCQTIDYIIFIKNTLEDPFGFDCKCEDCDPERSEGEAGRSNLKERG